MGSPKILSILSIPSPVVGADVIGAAGVAAQPFHGRIARRSTESGTTPVSADVVSSIQLQAATCHLRR
ncbi:MAG: hypothetical protein P4L98_14170, partial [Ancalomicrobiaceae bacterium]|nr:hypothetical protein [Ancalomicrobiaceae bacterium]